MTLVMNPVARAVRRSMAFSPLSLFANGEQGAWFDYSDFSTMFQDATGTIPVTAVGQPVGKILDKSGNGHHATQSTATARPILQQDEFGKYYLLFDGIDDFLVTGAIDFTITDKITVWVAFTQELNLGVAQALVEMSATPAISPGAFRLGPSSLGRYYVGLRGDSADSVALYSPSAPSLRLASSSFDISAALAADEVKQRTNGVDVSPEVTIPGPAGGGNFSNNPLYIGARGGSQIFFNGQLFGLIVRGTASSETEIANTEKWMNGKTGAY